MRVTRISAAAIVALALTSTALIAQRTDEESLRSVRSQDVRVTNFPAVQEVMGTVSVGNLPAVQEVSGTVTVANFPSDALPQSSVAKTAPSLYRFADDPSEDHWRSQPINTAGWKYIDCQVAVESPLASFHTAHVRETRFRNFPEDKFSCFGTGGDLIFQGKPCDRDIYTNDPRLVRGMEAICVLKMSDLAEVVDTAQAPNTQVLYFTAYLSR